MAVVVVAVAVSIFFAAAAVIVADVGDDNDDNNSKWMRAVCLSHGNKLITPPLLLFSWVTRAKKRVCGNKAL